MYTLCILNLELILNQVHVLKNSKEAVIVNYKTLDIISVKLHTSFLHAEFNKHLGHYYKDLHTSY